MKWIKCTDKMPEKYVSVLTYSYTGFHCDGVIDCRKKRITQATIEDGYNGEIIWRQSCDCFGSEREDEHIEPIYWMPLPEDPKD